MDESLKKKEEVLSHLEVDKDISSTKADIAEKKALEARYRKEYGHDWKKIIGYVSKMKPNREAIQDLYSINPELRDLSRLPTRGGRL